MGVTLGIAIASGIVGGWIASWKIFSPPHALFRDDEHFEEVFKRYNLSYFEGNDERLTEALNLINLVRKHIIAKDSDDHNEPHLKDLIS
jgi:hypothetical protein